MKNIFFLLLLITGSLSSQTISINSVKKLNLGNEKGYYPQLNRDGTSMLYTSENYEGLRMYNLISNTKTVVSKELGAGYRPVFAEDNSTIYFMKDQYIDHRKHSSLQAFNAKDGKTLQLEANSRVLKAPMVVNGKLVYKKNSTLKRVNSPVLKRTVKQLHEVYITIEDQKISLFINGKKNVLNPLDMQSYIWPSISPDGTKILAYAIGKGAFCCALDGKNIVLLGELQAPVWMDDNFVVGMLAKDDGHIYTESKIISINIKTKVRNTLSANIPMAMYPTASTAAKKIAFNTGNGEVYVLSFSIR